MICPAKSPAGIQNIFFAIKFKGFLPATLPVTHQVMIGLLSIHGFHDFRSFKIARLNLQ